MACSFSLLGHSFVCEILFSAMSRLPSHKRARMLEASGRFAGVVDLTELSNGARVPTELAETAIQAGEALRELLIGLFVENKPITAASLTRIAHFHSISAGVGMDDMAVLPAQEHNSARHVEQILAKKYGKPDLHYVTTPGHDKVNSKRTPLTVPIRFAHDQLALQHQDAPIPVGPDPCPWMPALRK